MTTRINEQSPEDHAQPDDQIADLIAAVKARSDIELILSLIDGVAGRVQTLTRQNTHLEFALDSNRRVGAAIGILMIQHRIAEPEAFARLRHSSQTLHRKLRDVAEDVILTGELPTS